MSIPPNSSGLRTVESSALAGDAAPTLNARATATAKHIPFDGCTILDE
jgi:hypothetical protein